MKKTLMAGWLTLAMALVFTLAGPALAAEVAGVHLDDKVSVAGNELRLNGAGVRTKVFFKVYVAGLYLRSKINAPGAIIASAEPRRISLHMLRKVDAEAMYSALREGLSDNLGDAQMGGILLQLDQLAVLMRQIGDCHEGDVVDIDLYNGNVYIALNGKGRGMIIGREFSDSLLRVWLGEHPVENSLKKALLGN